MSATRRHCASRGTSLDLTRQHAIVEALLDHVVVAPRPPRLQPLRRVPLAPGLARLSPPATPRPPPAPRGSVTFRRQPLLQAQDARPTPARGPCSRRQPHCAQQAGGPCHPSTLDDSQTRFGCATERPEACSITLVRPSRRSSLTLRRLESLRDLVAVQPRPAGPRRASLLAYFAR